MPWSLAMMSRILFALLLMAIFPVAGAEPDQQQDVLQAGLVNPGFHAKPDWFKQSFLDIREDISEAAEQDKRVLLYFYQDGCPYCKKLLETNFSLREISEKTRTAMDVIAINMWGDREVTDLSGNSVSEKQFAENLQVMFTPTLLFLDEQGEVVVRLNGYYPPHKFAAVVDYVGQHKEKELGFREYWAALSPPASSGKLYQDKRYLQEPYRLADRSGDKFLLVFFEQKECAPCDELHLDILRREESVELLQRFDVVVLDMWSKTSVQTPDGTDASAAAWSKQLGIQYAPTMVIFDTLGREVFRTEAYLKAFHIQSAMDYALSGAYRKQPNFQRFIQARANALEAQGIHIDLMQ
jgi:thioredoxin-related protein